MAATTSFRSVSGVILQPLKRIDAIPTLIILSFSHSLRTPTRLFSAAFYSNLKTPISPPPSFEATPIARFLINECEFSLNDANGICLRKPDLLGHNSYDNARQTLRFLRDKGFDEIAVRKLISTRPEILRSSFQDVVKPKVEFLEKIGLSGQKLSRVLEIHTCILSSSISRTLKPRVCLLQSVLDSELAGVVLNPESDEITGKLVSNHSPTVSFIYQNPKILTWPTENILVGLVKDVEEMGLEKGSKAFARVLLRLSMLYRDTINRKLENLSKLGFTQEEVGILLKRFPTILGLSEDRLRQNFKFLDEEWKLPRSVILSNPYTLGFSVKKRLKPRLQCLKALMTKNKSSKESESYPSLYYMCISERYFHRKVGSRLPVENEQ